LELRGVGGFNRTDDHIFEKTMKIELSPIPQAYTKKQTNKQTIKQTKNNTIIKKRQIKRIKDQQNNKKINYCSHLRV
jgi:hypothetical protein